MPAILTKRKLRIVSDPFLFVGVILVQIYGLTWVIVCFVNDEQWSVILFMSIVSTAWAATLIVAALTGANSWAHIVTIMEDGLLEGPIFTKREFHPYSDYPLVYCTSYVHGMIGSPDAGPRRMFIVLTDQRLRDAERESINLVRSSRRLVKIKYSKKRYTLLMEILPQNLKAQLSAAFLVQTEPNNLARRRSAITSKARRRRRQKRHK